MFQPVLKQVLALPCCRKSESVLRVLLWLLANSEDGYCAISQRGIAEDLGIGHKAVRCAISTLESEGVIFRKCSEGAQKRAQKRAHKRAHLSEVIKLSLSCDYKSEVEEKGTQKGTQKGTEKGTHLEKINVASRFDAEEGSLKALATAFRHVGGKVTDVQRKRYQALKPEEKDAALVVAYVTAYKAKKIRPDSDLSKYICRTLDTCLSKWDQMVERAEEWETNQLFHQAVVSNRLDKTAKTVF